MVRPIPSLCAGLSRARLSSLQVCTGGLHGPSLTHVLLPRACARAMHPVNLCHNFLRHANPPGTVCRMPFGIGAGAFGLRGGISTRGIGVGVGPFSAGTSFRGGRRSGGDIGFIPFLLLGVGLFLVAAWPYLLGT
jgi:hypothetical protein